MEKDRVRTRAEIPSEHRWNAESVYATPTDWQAEYAAVRQQVGQFDRHQGRLGESPEVLTQALTERDKASLAVYRLMMYAVIAHEVDSNDQEAAARVSQAQSLYGQAMAAGAFIEPELLAIGQGQLEAWMQSDPRLAVYDHYFRDLFRNQAHVRSGEVEEVLGMALDPFSGTQTTTGLLANADFKFAPAVTSEGDELPVTQSTYQRLMSHADRQARRTAWESYTDAYLAHKNGLSSLLTTSIKQNVFKMRVRRYPSTLEMALSPYNIPVEVFHNLIDTFQKNLPTWQRYFRARRKALGVAELQPYDMWAPLAPTKGGISFEQAVDWIGEGLAPLGSDYVEVLRKGCLEQRWVDRYPNQGKTAGAFSYGAPGTHPFIVLSYADNLLSLSTLAHELGHSMHSYLTWKTQPPIYSSYSLFVAEVASNFHQAMVRAYLLDHLTDRSLQINLIEEAMANFYRYFLIMPTLARFELEMHERVERGEGLTASLMVGRMADLFEEAFGGEVAVDRERVGITWATFGHLYEDYYVYQYATGISGAHALANRVLKEGSQAAQDYRSFLMAGSSLYPIDALKLAGVDLTTPTPVEETFAVLRGLVERLEELTS